MGKIALAVWYVVSITICLLSAGVTAALLPDVRNVIAFCFSIVIVIVSIVFVCEFFDFKLRNKNER